MKAIRALLWLLVAIALAAPPTSVAAAVAHQHVGKDCDGHGQAKQVVATCCVFATPCTLAEGAELPLLASWTEVPVSVESTLTGFSYSKDPPPPRE